jgi:hypothetical protein
MEKESKEKEERKKERKKERAGVDWHNEKQGTGILCTQLDIAVPTLCFCYPDISELRFVS